MRKDAFGKNPLRPGEFPGVYVLIDPVDGGYYVGSTSHLAHRYRQHKSLLRKEQHFCRPLQSRFKQHNQLPKLLVLEFTEELERLERENFWLQFLKRSTSLQCFNSAPTAFSNHGLVREKVFPKPISKLIGRVYSDDHRRKISIAARKRGRPIVRLDCNGQIIERFLRINDAVEKTGYNRNSIRTAMKRHCLFRETYWRLE